MWRLFLISAFPTHLWTIFLFLIDVAWITERTKPGDAVGVGAYGLVAAFFDSLGIFLGGALLGLLVSPKWGAHARLTLAGSLVWVVTGWALALQVYGYFGAPFPSRLIGWLGGLSQPVLFLYGVEWILVGVSVLLPVYFLLRSERLRRWVAGFFERVSLLMIFYLLLDATGLIIVVLRNI